MNKQHTLPQKRQERQLTVAEAIEFLLEMDDAIISPRPSIPLQAARLLQDLAVLADLYMATNPRSHYEDLELAMQRHFASYNTSLKRRRFDKSGW